MSNQQNQADPLAEANARIASLEDQLAVSNGVPPHEVETVRALRANGINAEGIAKVAAGWAEEYRGLTPYLIGELVKLRIRDGALSEFKAAPAPEQKPESQAEQKQANPFQAMREQMRLSHNWVERNRVIAEGVATRPPPPRSDHPRGFTWEDSAKLAESMRSRGEGHPFAGGSFGKRGQQ